ncbi:hypothetical protein TIFTF001_020678 [Ficus carica]|uniref:DDE Tnp4 domain-containing protein n=1 Tax=Ficus carica TaxID=3494 RepID=A0AA88DJN1_FICCA|nr:hypothetical protein TIFTF001_020678 [Ficus carica]
MNESGSASEHEEDDQDSENDQLDDDAMLAMAVVAVIASWRNRRRAPQPMHNSRLTGSMRVEEILNGHEEIIQRLISMKSKTFRALSNLLVLKVICVLKDKFIRPPDYTAVQHLILEYSDKYRPWFDGCIGAIDGTHVPCVPRCENANT